MIEITGYKDKSEYISDKGISSVVYLMDCLEGLKQMPHLPNCLGVVDPPYGIDIGEKAKSFSGKKFVNGNNWDNKIPSAEYFSELRRVSKNQIIWGGNYFLDYLGSTKCMIVWDKYNTNKGRFADGEIAWTSLDKPTRIATYEWLRWFQPDMKNKQIRIHPTQKPIQLYDWLMKEYASEGNLILDTHLGSGSSRIAAHKAGLSFVGFEIDADYYADQEKRFKNFTSQLRLF